MRGDWGRAFWPMAATAAALISAAPTAAQSSLDGVSIAATAARIDSADPAERRLAKSAALFGLAMPPERFADVLSGLRPTLERAMRDQAAALNQILPEDAPDKLLRIMNEEMTAVTASLAEAVSPIYAQSLTEAELDSLLALYRTEEGRRAMAKLTALSPRLSQAMESDLQRMTLRVLRRVQSELAAGGAPAPAPSRAPQAQ